MKIRSIFLSFLFCILLPTSVFAKAKPNFDLLENELKMLDEVDDADNVVISNYGLEASLGMLLEGATDEGKEALERFLCQTKEEMRLRSTELAKSEFMSVVKTGNSFWYDDTQIMQDDFVKNLETYYNADVKPLSKENVSTTVANMDAWLSNKTDGLVKNFVNDELFNDDALRNIELSVQYMDATWDEKFHVKENVEFKGTNGSEIVDFLEGEATTYYKNNHAVGFGKKYKDGLWFIGILPNDNTDSVESLEIPSLICDHGEECDVDVLMPRLDINCTQSFKKFLMKNGLAGALFEGGGLQGISDDPFLGINDMIQTTTMELDENGTRILSVTNTTVDSMAVGMTKSVTLDRPFVFLITDDNNNVLFMGKVNNMDVAKRVPGAYRIFDRYATIWWYVVIFILASSLVALFVVSYKWCRRKSKKKIENQNQDVKDD